MIEYFSWAMISYIIFMISAKLFEKTGDPISGSIGFISAPIWLVSSYCFATDFVKLVIDVLEKYLMS